MPDYLAIQNDYRNASHIAYVSVRKSNDLDTTEFTLLWNLKPKPLKNYKLFVEFANKHREDIIKAVKKKFAGSYPNMYEYLGTS